MKGKFLAVMAIFSMMMAFNIQSENTSDSMLLGNSILYVGGSGPGNYTHIQDAIDNATDGDTIFVYNGVYYENVIVNKSINLIGEDRNTTIIDGNKTGDVVNVSTDQVNITGFTIKNATDNTGMYIKSNHCKISNNNIMNNKDGVYLFSSSGNEINENSISNNSNGIYLNSSSSNEITNCDCYDNDYGIALQNSSENNDIANSTFYYNNNGIYLNYSSNNNILNCTCYDNYDGINLLSSSNNVIMRNNISSCDNDGIHLSSSLYNTISGNNISAIENGIYLFNSSYNPISNCGINNCAFNGIHLDSSSGNTIFGNKISNNLFGISLENSSNNAIENCNFRENYRAIYLGYSSTNDIEDCNISENDKGILLSESNNNTIDDCEIYSNIYEGIRILSSSGNSINSDIFDNGDGVILNSSSKNNIIYCNIYSNDDGIRVEDSSTDNNIINCEIHNNSNGISLIDSSNNSITSNIYNNSNGVYLEHSSTNPITDSSFYKNSNGIYLYSSSYNNISYCNAYNNSNAIYLKKSSSNNIIENDISNNDRGIYIKSSSNSNSIYRNNFIHNTAYDECLNNWDNDSVGNYWSDYTGSDTNGDRRGDGPYYIHGDSNQDWYPLMYRWGEIPPIANFTWAPEYPTDLETVNFIDNSTDLDGYIGSRTWNFGDGNVSYGKNVEHRYADNGIYQVNLTVRDNTGREAIKPDQITISNEPPIALFSWEWEAGAENSTQNVHFIDKSVDLDGNITIWYWDFGDGYTSNKKNPFHNYSHEGSYIVTLTVSDNDYDESEPVSKEITVSNSPPIANFTWTSESPTTLDKISFSDKSKDLDGFIVQWHWDFGDGEASVERNATHRYDDEGKYTVTLTVKDNDGATSTYSIKIEIKKEVRYQLIPGFEALFIIAAIFIALFGRKIKLS